MSLFDEIREACAEVTRRARFVRIDEAGLLRLARSLSEDAPPPSEDPAHHPFESDATTLSFVITLDAVNFGSGYFPHLVKREGRSGYFTIAGALEDHVRRNGPLDARALCGVTAASCGELFGQPMDGDPVVAELMGLFAAAWRELGERLQERHGGEFERLVASAGGCAEALVRELASLSAYRDECVYQGDLRVLLYKRAQITVSDLYVAFGGQGHGAFSDIDSLTMFPDNLVPHVLRVEGVLDYAPSLLRRIDAGELLEVGSDEEIEIRAVGLHAVERLVGACRQLGMQVNAPTLDHRLWHLGQDPRIKAQPRHRTRCTFY